MWALTGLVVLLAGALVVVLVTRSDERSEGPSAPTTSRSVPPPASTTVPAGTTTRPPVTTTTLPLPTLVANDPESYAKYLFAAWRNNDRTAATRAASENAVGQIFVVAFDAARGYTFTQCGAAAGSAYCTWTASNGSSTLVLQVRTATGGQPVQVIGVTRNN